MKKIDLGKDNINKLLLSFSIPCVVSMLINSIYNIVDQIFIGQGVGTLGNAATNVIFPLIIVFNAVASLIGNGAAANLSLKLGEKNEKEAAKGVGQAVMLTTIVSILLGIFSYIAMPKLVMLFGCTENVYKYAVEYGRIICIGAPFMIIYSSLSNIIRADGSPKYSMILLVIGAIINIILDPIFIFVFNKGVAGGAIATVIGQFVSFLLAIIYIKKFKSIKLSKESMKLNKDIFRVLGLGLSSFITQCTVLVLFVFMNNMMTKLGALSKFGADIPLSVYGVISKINSIYISIVLGVSIGAQPIIGFNYGAGNKERVKETIKRVLIVNFIIGLIFNIIFFFFPKQLAGIFIKSNDPSYELFIEFAILMCHSFFLVMGLNAFEMTGSVTIQALGKVKKATAFSFIRQIILLIPISLLLSLVLNKGIYGIAYAGCISDILCFIIAIVIVRSEFVSLSKKDYSAENNVEIKTVDYTGKHIVVTISREYASGGRYVGKLLAEKLGINFYDKELIELAAKESGLSNKYIEETDEQSRKTENDDRIFIAETKIIKDLAEKESCVIVGRCADYILRDSENVLKVFLYSDEKNKFERGTKYYGLNPKTATKEIEKINKDREKHYKFYTNREWKDFENYDIIMNVDLLGVEKTAEYIKSVVSGDGSF